MHAVETGNSIVMPVPAVAAPTAADVQGMVEPVAAVPGLQLKTTVHEVQKLVQSAAVSLMESAAEEESFAGSEAVNLAADYSS